MPSMQSQKTEEKEISMIYGAKPTKNSGRGKHEKGDAMVDCLNLTIDIKESYKSFGVSLSSLAKLNSDSKKNGTGSGAFMISLGESEPKQRYVVLRLDVFNEMAEVYDESRQSE